MENDFEFIEMGNDEDCTTRREDPVLVGPCSFTPSSRLRRQPESTWGVTMHKILVLIIISSVALCVSLVRCATDGDLGNSDDSNKNRNDMAVVDILFPRTGTLVGQTFFPGFKLIVPDDKFLQVGD